MDGRGGAHLSARGRASWGVLIVAAIVSIVACGGPRATTVPEPAFSTDHMRMLELVNQARSSATDCGARGWFPASGPLSLEGRLTAVAQAHTSEMRARGRISHTGADGSSVGDRVTRRGYGWSTVGENVASGFDSPEAVVAGWIGSPGHCANVMHDRFVHLGVGHEGGYWTQVFARPR